MTTQVCLSEKPFVKPGNLVNVRGTAGSRKVVYVDGRGHFFTELNGRKSVERDISDAMRRDHSDCGSLHDQLEFMESSTLYGAIECFGDKAAGSLGYAIEEIAVLDCNVKAWIRDWRSMGLNTYCVMFSEDRFRNSSLSVEEFLRNEIMRAFPTRFKEARA